MGKIDKPCTLDLAPDVDDEATGKNIESLIKSRRLRAEFIEEYGCVPTTILVHDKADKAIDFHAPNTYDTIPKAAKFMEESAVLNRKVWHAFNASKGQIADKKLSRFSQNIGRLLVRFYCPHGGIVYDPFAGHNSRMQLVFECGRHYIGVDVCKQFQEDNELIKAILLKRHKQQLTATEPPSITLILGSSDKVDLPDNYADFTITSPPYYDLEYYGDEPEQLGNAPTYEAFLGMLYNHVQENFRILKPGSYCIWNVNDFRRKGVFHAYHADLIDLFKRAGFRLENIYIIDLGTSFTVAFAQTIKKTRMFAKRHEYLMLFRKPDNVSEVVNE